MWKDLHYPQKNQKLIHTIHVQLTIILQNLGVVN
jgi:hypothetical protein